MPTETIGDNSGDDYSGSEFAEIREASPTSNFGSNSLVSYNPTGSSTEESAVIGFSGISNITSGTVTSASMYMYQSSFSGNTHTISANRLLVSFTESQVTWNIRSTGNNWNTGGAKGSGTDRSSTQTGVWSFPSSPDGYYAITDGQLITDCQNLIDGTWTIPQWITERTDSNSGTKNIDTDDGTDGERPYLSITYSTGASLTEQILDSVGVTDSNANIIGFIRSQLESIGITDTQSRTADYSRTESNNVGVTDTSTKSIGFFRTVADNVGITDAVSWIITGAGVIFVSISNAVGITDSQSRIAQYFRSRLESVGISDTVTRSPLTILKSFADTVGISDIVTKILNPFAEVYQKIFVKIFGDPRIIIEINGNPETEIEIPGNPETDIKIYGDF
jgi:hypothetical protein